MKYLCDANIISEFQRDPDGKAASRYYDRIDECGTSVIVASEIRFGVAKHPERKGSVGALRLLEDLPVAAFEHPADLHYAEIRATLEKAGTPIGANDMLIAAHALALDATLVTANEREFRRVPGLRVENWAA
jgi:tRNA(fMet)-specific endonuclease VapC